MIVNTIVFQTLRLKITENHLSIKNYICDRDGTINVKPKMNISSHGMKLSYWKTPSNEGTCTHDFKFIIISNQAGIARGILNPNDVERVNKRLKNTLKKEGIEIIDSFVCPHHWD